MLMQTSNLENLMITQNGLSGKGFSMTLSSSMESHQLTSLHLESIKKWLVMCHGDQTLRQNLLMLSLSPGLKKDFMPSLLLA